jgi:hypothetical protein
MWLLYIVLNEFSEGVMVCAVKILLASNICNYV